MQIEYSPSDPQTNANPFPILKRLQEEDPVHWNPELQSWVLTRYEDVKDILGNRKVSADRLTPFFKHQSTEQRNRIPDLIRYLNLWMVFRDPPEHTRLRNLINKAFVPKKIETLRPNIEQIVHQLLDQAQSKEQVDLIKDFAAPLPALVIMDMLGVPPESLPQMKKWSDEIALFIGSARATENKYEIAQKGAMEMAAFFREMVTQRERKPHNDMISDLIAARNENQALTEDEVIGTCILILFAGHETTTNLIGNGILALLRHPDQFQRLSDDPSLVPTAVEEMLRYDGPSLSAPRIVIHEHELQGKTLKKHDRVFAVILAANRDRRIFAEPDQFDITRTHNPHIAFGHNIHFCTGAGLARLEGQIAVNAVVQRFPHLKCLDDQPQWNDSLILRGVKSLNVTGLKN